MAGGAASGSSVIQSGAPRRKVIAATSGAAVGSAVAVILTWLLEIGMLKAGITLPDQIKIAFNSIFTTLSAFIFGYYTSPGISEAVIQNQDGRPRSALKQ